MVIIIMAIIIMIMIIMIVINIVVIEEQAGVRLPSAHNETGLRLSLRYIVLCQKVYFVE